MVVPVAVCNVSLSHTSLQCDIINRCLERSLYVSIIARIGTYARLRASLHSVVFLWVSEISLLLIFIITQKPAEVQ